MDIFAHGPNEHHAHHRTQEDDDNNRVDQAEPMNLRVKYMEVVIPS